MRKKYWITGLSIGLYIFLGYFVQRPDGISLIFSYSFLFLLYVWAMRESEKDSDYLFWVAAAILFRFCFLFSEPQLSDDYFRYIWDGRMWANGLNAFSKIPSDVVGLNVPGLTPELFHSLNSKQYYTVYPPLTQFIFWLSVKFSSNSILGSIIIIRGLIVLAELGTIWLLQNLLQSQSQKKSTLFIYALNPLVILELTGNLHFEVFVIFFLTLSIYFIDQKKWTTSAVNFGLAISAKLLPLILLPSMLKFLGWKRSLYFYLTVSIVVAFLFIGMFYGDWASGIGSSLQLYFNSFEFNASIYYLVREYGFYTRGYNIIQTVGWKLAILAGVLILVISFWKKMNKGNTLTGWIETLVWVYGIYFLLATTVHPWYITPIIALCVFTSFRFSVVWSYSIFMTYLGYSVSGYVENLWIVFIEYFVVIGFLVYEIWQHRFS